MKRVKHISAVVATIVSVAFFSSCASQQPTAEIAAQEERVYATASVPDEPVPETYAPSVYPAGTVVHSMAYDADLKEIGIGGTFEHTTWLRQSGAPTITIVEREETFALQISGRSNDWDAIDLQYLSSLSQGSYSIKVTGRAQPEAKVKLAQTNNPWGTFVEKVVEEDGLFTLESTFDGARLIQEGAVRIQTEGSTGDFYIYSIEITAK